MKITDSQLYKYVPKAEKLWLSWLPTDEEIPEHIFSKRFERKMKRLIRNQRRTPRIRKIFLTAKRITAAVLVLTMLSFSGLMTVEAYREKFIEMITEVMDDLTHFKIFSSWNESIRMGEIIFGYLHMKGKGDGFYEKVYSQAVLWLFLCHYMRVLSGDSRLCCGIA